MTSWLREPRTAKLALVVLAIAYVIAHVIAALVTEAANWDEFVLLSRAERAVRTGVLDGGGRPGLGVALLVPFVDGCTSTMAVVTTIRIVWCVFTFALLAGLFAFLRGATRRDPDAWQVAALGVALLACVPLFLRWSLQIRTDQPAIAAALWAGVALLASRRTPSLGILAGALAGTGYLFSQKAVYVTALIAVVAAGEHYIDRELVWRRELRRAVGVLVGAGLALGAYKLIIPLVFASPQRAGSIEGGLDLFRWYRFVLRFRLYGSIVSTVVPHLVLLGLILAAAVRAGRRDTPQRRPLQIAVLVAVLGVAVARFHTASFPYFWITIGVFPAVAIALGWAGIRELLPRAHVPVAIGAWAMVLVLGVVFRAETLRDTQQIQRDTFAFIDRELDLSRRGFHADGGLVCRQDPDPFRVYLGQTITFVLGGAEGQRNTAALIEEFRSRPLAFVIKTSRLASFPRVVSEFWASHYVLYAHAVMLPGRRIAGAAATTHEVDVIVPGTYRWIPGVASQAARLGIAGTQLRAGETLTLTRGVHRAELLDPVAAGMLVLAVTTPPGATASPFYDEGLILELAGARRDWW